MLRLLASSTILPLLATVGLAACGPDDPPLDQPVDARTDAPVDGPVNPSGDVVCTTSPGRITLGIRAGGAVPASRLAVIFYQFNDDVTPAPALVVGHDVALAALAAGETRCVEIDPAQIQAPTDDAHQLCIRTCFDLSQPACACPASGPRVATAAVAVGQDLDGNQALDASEITEANIHGSGWLGIAGSPERVQPPSALDPLFPEGIEQGVRAYRIIPGTGTSGPGRFDRLGLDQPGTTYQVKICPPGATDCTVRFPNLS